MLNGYEVEDERESRFEAEYKISKLLYNGTFSAVYECVHKPSNEKFAVKIVDVPRFLTVHSKEQLANETKIAEILLNHTDPTKPCRHPHLVTPLDCRSEPSKYYMIYERLHHRDICFEIEHRVAQFVYGEHIARHYMRQILEAVRYMHLKAVVHRDLKVSCILLAKSDQIKIGGFRAAVKLPEMGYMQDSHVQSGTVQYMAPEVIRCEFYGRPVDMWGCGVVLYILLTGTLPFTGKTVDVYKRVLSAPDFTADKWSEVSVTAKQLCQRMLTSDQHQRIIVDDALAHPWIKSSEGISKSPLKRAIIQMRTFNARRKIQSAINIAANSSLWDKMAAVTHSHKFKRIPTSMSTVPPVLDPLETKTMNKAVNDVITMIQDSVEEAHILHEVPQYVFNTSVVHDPKLTTLLKLYDRIAVDLSSAFSRDSISFITNDSSSGGGGNDAPEAGVFNLATEVLSALQHQLDTNQSFTPQDSSQMRGILQNFHFTALLRAHDVIVSEFFGDDSMRCSPVVEANSSTDPLSASPMPLIFSSGGTCTRSAAKGTSTAIETTSSSKKQHWGDNTHHHHQQTTVFCGREALEHHRSNSDTHMTSNGDCNRAAADHLSSCGAAAPGAGGGTALATVDNSNLTLPSSSPGLAPKSNITRVKLLNFHRNPGEPLGIILKILKTDHVVVSRIMIGGMIHRQKILSEGDEILEINGQSIRKHFSEDALRSLLNEISGDIVIKVKSNNTGATNTEPSSDCFFVRAMFDYRPEEDTTCQAAAAFGLAFQARDILQILKQKLPPEQQQYNLDKLGSSRQSLSSSVAPEELTAAAVPHHLNTAASLASITESQRWWQAQVVCRASETTELNAHYNDDLNRIFSNPASSKRKVGLVPSCLWRMEMIKNEKMSASKIRSSCGLFKKKKKVNMIELSEDEIYERVVHMTDPVPRRSLLLVGAPGVGRRSIKNALIQMDQRFAYPKPHTNKPRCVPDENCGEEEGGVVSGGGSSFLYHHVPHQELIGAANRGEYLELGKYNEYFFGTKYDTIDRIIASHLIPVLDIEPDSIKKLRNAKYMPYVVFVDAPRCFENAPTDDASIVQSFEQLLSVSGEIDRHYRALFDMTVVNSNIEQTVNIIRSAFDLVSTSTNHWLPLNWVQSEHCCNTSTTSAAINSRTSSLQRRHSKMSLPNS